MRALALLACALSEQGAISATSWACPDRQKRETSGSLEERIDKFTQRPGHGKKVKEKRARPDLEKRKTRKHSLGKRGQERQRNRKGGGRAGWERAKKGKIPKPSRSSSVCSVSRSFQCRKAIPSATEKKKTGTLLVVITPKIPSGGLCAFCALASSFRLPGTLDAHQAGPAPRPLVGREYHMSRRKAGVDGFEELSGSIDRSRKRHLEEGLLRGDLVKDRLAVQEASASPLLKRTRPSSASTTPPAPPTHDDMAMTMAEFREYMDNNTNKRIGDLDRKVGGMQATVEKLDKAVEHNTNVLQQHEEQIQSMKRQLDKAKDESFPPLRPDRPLQTASLLPPVPQRDPAYDLARRSLRLWPIAGASRDELWHSVGVFLGTNLGLEGKLDKKAVETVERVILPSGPGVINEALVRFTDVATRDLVMGNASKLGPYQNDQGRATAGMRMEVPPKLTQMFRVLFKYGQNLRARHGQGTRRHVKFNDPEQSLYLNVKLPGDEQWSKVSIEVALRGIRARESINDSQLERRLDITGCDAPRQRAMSTTGPPPPTQASAWTRRSGGSSSS